MQNRSEILRRLEARVARERRHRHKRSRDERRPEGTSVRREAAKRDTLANTLPPSLMVFFKHSIF